MVIWYHMWYSDKDHNVEEELFEHVKDHKYWKVVIIYHKLNHMFHHITHGSECGRDRDLAWTQLAQILGVYNIIEF